MQETTFNSPNQREENFLYESIHEWLDALYTEALQKNSLKNFDLNKLVMLSSVKNLQSTINYHFNNSELLINALTQSTFCYEFNQISNTSINSNERLEFLGDSLVNFLVAKILFNRYPNSSEGELSKLRGALVNEFSLSQLANAISLGENLLLGKGEHKNLGKLKESLLANTLEALLAAVYIDSGEDSEVLENILLAVIKKYELETGGEFFALANLELFDSKTKLQELSVALFFTLPVYKSALDEKNSFSVELWIGERKLAEGHGPSKKKLEKELARIVLDEKRYLL